MDVYHDRYQIRKIRLNVYLCQYEIGGILPESVSLYTLKGQFISDITQCTHTSRKGASSRALCHRATVNNTEKVAIWMASIAKMCIFTAFGCARTPYAAVGRKEPRTSAAVPAQRPSMRPTLAVCGLFVLNTTGYTEKYIRPTFPQRGGNSNSGRRML